MFTMFINKKDVEMEDLIKYSELIIEHNGKVEARAYNKIHAKLLWVGLSEIRTKLVDIKDINLFYRFTLALTAIENDLLKQIGGY